MEKKIQDWADDELHDFALDGGMVNADFLSHQRDAALAELQIRQQKAMLKTQREESAKLMKVNWALVGVTLLIGIATMAVTLYIARSQSNDELKKESATLMLQFYNGFRDRDNSPLVYAVAINKPLLVQNGGKFTEEQLDNYLVKYEILYNAYANNLISEDDLNTAFGFDIEKASKNAEIQTFISNVRKENNDPGLYNGFAQLIQLIKKIKK